MLHALGRLREDDLRRPGQRAARHPGRGRRLGQVALRAPGPVHDGRGLLRPAPAAASRPTTRPWSARASWCTGLGGADRTRFFTKLWLAVLGHYPWEHLPVLPARDDPAARPRAPLSPYRFACWARGTFVALMIVLSRQPTYPQPVGLDELFTDPPGHGPRRRAQDARAAGRPLLTRAMGWRARYNRRPIRAAAPAGRGARGALDLRPPGGRRLVGRHPAAVGLLDHRAARAGLAARPPGHRAGAGRLRRHVHACDDGDRLRIQACLSPVWDTCLAAVALADAGAAARRPGPRARPATGCCRRRSPGSATGTTSRAAGGRAAGRSSSRTSGTPTPTTPPRC